MNYNELNEKLMGARTGLTENTFQKVQKELGKDLEKIDSFPYASDEGGFEPYVKKLLQGFAKKHGYANDRTFIKASRSYFDTWFKANQKKIVQMGTDPGGA